MDPVDVSGVLFKEIGKWSLESSWKPEWNGQGNRPSVLALAEPYQLLFILEPAAGKLHSLSTASAYQLLSTAKDAPKPISSVPSHRSLSLPPDLELRSALLRVSADGANLALACKRSGVGPVALIFDTRAFHPDQKKPPSPYLTIRLGNEAESEVLDFQWDPALVLSRFAVSLSNKNLALHEINSGGVHELKATRELISPAAALAWSPKGKQIAVGMLNGSIQQLNPELKLYRSIDAPSQAQLNSPESGPFTISSLAWLRTLEFAVLYTPLSKPYMPLLAILTAQKDKAQTAAAFTALDDVCFGSGEALASVYSFNQIVPWKLLITSSSLSGESVVVGAVPGSGRDEPASWRLWNLAETGRPELPLPAQGQAMTIGATLDLCKAPLTALQGQSAPVLWLAGLDGALRAFALSFDGVDPSNLLGASTNAVLSQPAIFSSQGLKMGPPLAQPPARVPQPSAPPALSAVLPPAPVPALPKPQFTASQPSIPVNSGPKPAAAIPKAPEPQPSKAPPAKAAVNKETEAKAAREAAESELAAFRLDLDALGAEMRKGLVGLGSTAELAKIPEERLKLQSKAAEVEKKCQKMGQEVDSLVQEVEQLCWATTAAWAELEGAANALDETENPHLEREAARLKARLAEAEEKILECFHALSALQKKDSPKMPAELGSRRLAMAWEAAENMGKVITEKRQRLHRLAMELGFQGLGPRASARDSRAVSELTAVLHRSRMLNDSINKVEVESPQKEEEPKRLSKSPAKAANVSFARKELGGRAKLSLPIEKQESLAAWMKENRPNGPKKIVLPIILPPQPKKEASPPPIPILPEAQKDPAPSVQVKPVPVAPKAPTIQALPPSAAPSALTSLLGAKPVPSSVNSTPKVSEPPPLSFAGFGAVMKTPSTTATTMPTTVPKATPLISAGGGGFSFGSAGKPIVPATATAKPKPAPAPSTPFNISSLVGGSKTAASSPPPVVKSPPMATAKSSSPPTAAGIPPGTSGQEVKALPKPVFFKPTTTAPAIISPSTVVTTPAAPAPPKTTAAPSPPPAAAITVSATLPKPPSIPAAPTATTAASVPVSTLTSTIPPLTTTVPKTAAAVPTVTSTVTTSAAPKPIFSPPQTQAPSNPASAPEDTMEDVAPTPLAQPASPSFSFAPKAGSPFGSSSPPPTGGSIFGGASPSAGSNTGGSIFGGSAFGGLGAKPNPENASKNVFGSGLSGTFGTGGAAASPSGAQSSSIFGGSSPFGGAKAGGSSFGGQSPFGAAAQAQQSPSPPAPGGSSFGAAPSFGGSSGGGSIFGGSSGFGASPSFGGAQTGSAFGSGATFGSSSPFGGAAASGGSTFGGGKIFGSSSPPQQGQQSGFAALAGGSSFGGSGAPSQPPSQPSIFGGSGAAGGSFSQWR